MGSGEESDFVLCSWCYSSTKETAVTDGPDDINSLAEKVRDLQARLASIEKYVGKHNALGTTASITVSPLEKRLKALENKAGLNPRA
jgi:hypothetical protein